ncbi:hypothetical protein H647_07735 [Francisella tularensis subsp. tularensis 80700069]|nr:hypothetical protein H647_07735 [Francisella tularensis subsp. tularensis 80700069]
MQKEFADREVRRVNNGVDRVLEEMNISLILRHQTLFLKIVVI